MQNIAVLGLGIMGGGMASNLIRKGFRVTVWNRSPERTVPFAAQGARVAASPREAAAGADMVIAMVADDAASRSVWEGEAGALGGLKAGAIAVESSTLSPTWIRALAALAKMRGADFLDAPVGGSRPAAAEGKLTFFVGGEAAVLA